MAKSRSPRKKSRGRKSGRKRWILLTLLLVAGAFFPWPVTRFADRMDIPMGPGCEPLRVALGSASFSPALGLRARGLSAENGTLRLQAESARIGLSFFRGGRFAPGPGTVTLESARLATGKPSGQGRAPESLNGELLIDGMPWRCLEPSASYPPPRKIKLRRFRWAASGNRPEFSADHLSLAAHTEKNGALEIEVDGQGLSLGTRNLESVVLRARSEGPAWELRRLRARFLDGTLEGEGALDPVTGEARFDFKAHSLDLASLPPPRSAPGAAVQGRCHGRLRLKHAGPDWLPKNPLRITALPGWEGQAEGQCRDVVLDHLPFQGSYLVKNFMPSLQTLKLDKVEVDSLRLHQKGWALQGLRAQGPQLTLEGKGDRTFGQDVRLWLTLHFNPDFMDEVEGVVREAVTLDSLERPSLSLALEGDWERQALILPKKTVGKVVSSQFRKIGRSLGKLFGGGDGGEGEESAAGE